MNRFVITEKLIFFNLDQKLATKYEGSATNIKHTYDKTPIKYWETTEYHSL